MTYNSKLDASLADLAGWHRAQPDNEYRSGRAWEVVILACVVSAHLVLGGYLTRPSAKEILPSGELEQALQIAFVDRTPKVEAAITPTVQRSKNGISKPRQVLRSSGWSVSMIAAPPPSDANLQLEVPLRLQLNIDSWQLSGSFAKSRLPFEKKA